MLRLSFVLLIVGACAHPQKSASSMAPTPVEPAPTADKQGPKDLLEAKEPPAEAPPAKADEPMPTSAPPPPPAQPSKSPPKSSKKSPPKSSPAPDRSADPCEGGQ